MPDNWILALLIAVIIAVALLRRTSSDPYGLFHLDLNRLPGENPTSTPATEWLNLGYWKDTTLFPEACRALAQRMVQSVSMPPNAAVLDVGHGTGESVIMLSGFHPKPASITGVTSLELHSQRTARRVSEKASPTSPKMRFYCGDAVYRPGCKEGHPLGPEARQVYDRVFALDCAFHFETRNAFLAQVFGRLRPGGRVALADICVSSSPRNPVAGWLLSLGMSKSNIVTLAQYEGNLKELGYTNIRVEDISEDVFPGFVCFLKGRGWNWWTFGIVMNLLYTRAGARYVIASAEKPIMT